MGGQAQMTSREGLYGGISLGYFHYTTHWYYHGGGTYYDNYASHGINRLVVSLSLEKKALAEAGHFNLDLGGELLLGPLGSAKANYISGDNKISSGGWAVGLNTFCRAVYMPSSTGNSNSFFPFISLGPQYMYLHNNGKGDAPAIQQYHYSDGWNEGVLLLAASIGVDFHLDNVVLTPELRFPLFGWNSTDWEPGGRDVSMDGGPGFIAFGLRVAKRL